MQNGRVPKYLAEFAPALEIDESLSLLECRGTIGNKHIFLSEEGATECKLCHKIVCPLCAAKSSGLTRKSLMGCLCIGCYGTSALAGNEATMDIDEKSNEEKRKVICTKNNIYRTLMSLHWQKSKNYTKQLLLIGLRKGTELKKSNFL